MIILFFIQYIKSFTLQSKALEDPLYLSPEIGFSPKGEKTASIKAYEVENDKNGEVVISLDANKVLKINKDTIEKVELKDAIKIVTNDKSSDIEKASSNTDSALKFKIILSDPNKKIFTIHTAQNKGCLALDKSNKKLTIGECNSKEAEFYLLEETNLKETTNEHTQLSDKDVRYLVSLVKEHEKLQEQDEPACKTSEPLANEGMSITQHKEPDKTEHKINEDVARDPNYFAPESDKLHETADNETLNKNNDQGVIIPMSLYQMLNNFMKKKPIVAETKKSEQDSIKYLKHVLSKHKDEIEHNEKSLEDQPVYTYPTKVTQREVKRESDLTIPSERHIGRMNNISDSKRVIGSRIEDSESGYSRSDAQIGHSFKDDDMGIVESSVHQEESLPREIIKPSKKRNVYRGVHKRPYSRKIRSNSKMHNRRRRLKPLTGSSSTGSPLVLNNAASNQGYLFSKNTSVNQSPPNGQEFSHSRLYEVPNNQSQPQLILQNTPDQLVPTTDPRLVTQSQQVSQNMLGQPTAFSNFSQITPVSASSNLSIAQPNQGGLQPAEAAPIPPVNPQVYLSYPSYNSSNSSPVLGNYNLQGQGSYPGGMIQPAAPQSGEYMVDQNFSPNQSEAGYQIDNTQNESENKDDRRGHKVDKKRFKDILEMLIKMSPGG